MNQISIFNFNQSPIRVQLVNNEPYFCLSDVTNVLNMNRRSSEAFGLKEKGCKKITTLTKGGNQEIIYINEPNLYRVIFRSNKPEAVKFQDWIFEEVIPQIRKTGGYQTSGSLPLQQPQLPALSPLDDNLVLSIGRLLLHAQDMRLFVNRYLPAFENLGITNHGALWSYVHDTEPTFKRVREFFLQQTPYKNHHLFADDSEWLRRKVIATAKTHESHF